MRSYNCCHTNTQENRGILSQSTLLKLIAEESRLKLLCILRNGTHCVHDLMAHVDLSQSLISHHLANLRKAGIVENKKKGRTVAYSLTIRGRQVVRLLAALTEESGL